MIALADLPLETRTQAAWSAIRDGADPYDMLAAALWPNATLREVGEIVEGFCEKGHPWTRENTYINPRTGWRRCRACIKISGSTQRARLNRNRKNEKVPCVLCGQPATKPGKQGAKGSGIARCRACFLAGRRKS